MAHHTVESKSNQITGYWLLWYDVAAYLDQTQATYTLLINSKTDHCTGNIDLHSAVLKQIRKPNTLKFMILA